MLEKIEAMKMKSFSSSIPAHVTWLFSLLCCCQVLLFLQINRHILYVSDTKPLSTVFATDQDPKDVVKSSKSINKYRNQHQNQIYVPSKLHYRSRRAHQIVSEDYILTSDLQPDETLYYADYNIRYHINQPHACSALYEDGDDKSPYLLVLVHSHPSHKAQRDAIRDTWGKIRKDFDAPLQVRLVFILGLSESDLPLAGPKRESKLYRDIVMGTFVDSYRNLTLKSIFGIQWAVEYCTNVKYVLKTDDDTYFNLPPLLQHLQSLRNISMLGSLNTNAPVQRQGLWQVKQDQFSNTMYPPYCSGCAYLLSQDILPALLTASKTSPMLPIEDVYVTGVLAHAIGEQCKHSTHFPYWYLGPSAKHICLLLRNSVFGLHNVPYEKMYAIHKQVSSRHLCGKV